MNAEFISKARDGGPRANMICLVHSERLQIERKKSVIYIKLLGTFIPRGYIVSWIVMRKGLLVGWKAMEPHDVSSNVFAENIIFKNL